MAFRLRIDGTSFRDHHGREVILHGINVSADAKFPYEPNQPSHIKLGFLDGDNVSFVGRPFPISEASDHFSQLKRWGYNTIRYIFTWEAIEAAGPGKYDESWIQHTISLLRLAKSYGFFIFMDPHQDVWSRFTGGSGAPMWTLYACGLNPEKFSVTEAALVHNLWPDPAEFPKMIWSTNYSRLACQVLFTLFFAGKTFAPKAIIDGQNIQDYLQGHYINACKHLASRIKEAGDLDGFPIIGWESMNEPNKGLIGTPDLSAIPSQQKLQKGTSPTAWQAILTGSGRACEIPTWDFGGLGPYKTGSQLVDPHGQTAWLPQEHDDTRYGWKRDPGWKLGQCIWAQHGVWDPQSDTLLKKGYFAKDPSTGQEITNEYFTDNFFLQHFRGYRDAIRDVFPETFMLCQAPAFELPPSLKGTNDEDSLLVYAVHWYDGITLMTKKWNRFWNVDVLGVLRGRYLAPPFAIKLGETAIRNSFRSQLSSMRQEGLDHMGVHPCIFTELGVPYDMNNKYAYQSGDYTSQVLAMDANHFALEGTNPKNFTLWTYCATNVHRWGDNWNGEDLSIFSLDDPLLPTSHSSDSALTSTSSFSRASTSPSASNLMSTSSKTNLLSHNEIAEKGGPYVSGDIGFRAAEAYVRPTPVAVAGTARNFSYDLKKNEFKLELDGIPTTEQVPTVVFLPYYHYPEDSVEVEVSDGRYEIVVVGDGKNKLQQLQWWHAEGQHTLKIKGTAKRTGLWSRKQETKGVLEHLYESYCNVM